MKLHAVTRHVPDDSIAPLFALILAALSQSLRCVPFEN